MESLDSGPRYLPILKARQGELRALQELADLRGDVTEDLLPIIEVVDVDFSGNIDDRRRQLQRTTGKLVTAWPPGRPRVVVDTLNVENGDVAWDSHEVIDEEPSVIVDLFAMLRSEGVRAVPVMRLSDPPERREELRGLVDWSVEWGGCLRIGTEDLDDQVLPLDQAVEIYLDDLGVDPMTVDLVLDFAAVDDDHTAAMASRLARFVLPTLDRERWRSFALGSGAFPVNLGEVGAYAVTEVPRRDRQLWLQLNQLRLRRALDYADYAVTHPLLQTGVAFAAPPQIRYTSSGHWLVAKGRRTDRRGHRQFFDLCERVRRERPTEIAPASRTWGDAQFHVAADKAGTEEPGPGNASTWRAIATSHHIGHVMNSLRTRSEP